MTVLPSFDGNPLPAHLSVMAGAPPETNVFTGEGSADTVIIGAGFTGLSAALHLAETGVKPVVLEARDIGWGSSGRAFGQMAPSTKFSPAALELRLGKDAAFRLNQGAANGPSLVVELAQKYGMNAAAAKSGNIMAAHTPAALEGVLRNARDLQKRGFPVRILDRAELALLTGTDVYYGGFVDERGGSVNPLGLSRGLAHAAVAKGAKIHTNSRVESLERTVSGWRLKLAQGSLEARQVILATNAFSAHLWPALGRSIIPIRAYQMLGSPLGDAASTILPQRQTLNDTIRMPSGIRVLTDGRLQVGVDGPTYRTDGKAFVAKLDRRIRAMFPQLPADFRWEEQWVGWADMSVDHLPHLHRLASGLFAGVGFGGRGVAMGVTMGRDLAHIASGAADEELVHPVSAVKPLWFHAIAQPLVAALSTWYRLRDDWEVHHHITAKRRNAHV